MNQKLIMIVPLLALCPIAAVAASSGAIFTTDVGGTIVNANVQYASKCDVYLDGGPGPNAPAKAAGLPEGYYYFQVTDPSGKTLLSTDPVNNRQVHVNSGGVIDQYIGNGTAAPHPTGFDRDHYELKAITVRLATTGCPADFLDSPNGGGVYKVWVTPSSDFVGTVANVDNSCGNGCYHGFVASKSKTDNFKVVATTATFCLNIVKQLVDGDIISPGKQWPMTVTDNLGVTNEYKTNDTGSTDDKVCGLVAGTYTVQEGAAPVGLESYSNVGLKVNGVTLPPQNIYSFLWTAQRPNPFVVVFQNGAKDIGPQ